MRTQSDNGMADFVKYNRKKLGLTQAALAQKAGLGLRFIRDLEQGKLSLRLDKVNQVLALFGHQASPVTTRKLDPYEILWNNMNKTVRVTLKDKTVLYGIILEAINENVEIKAWKFVPNNNAIAWQKSQDPKLETIINHTDIINIENV